MATPPLGHLCDGTILPEDEFTWMCQGDSTRRKRARLSWPLACCQVPRPHEGDLPVAQPCGLTLLEPQVFLREMGMRRAIYNEPFEGSDVVPLPAGMRRRGIRAAPLAHYGASVPVLPILVGRTIEAAAQALAHLGEIELARQKQGA